MELGMAENISAAASILTSMNFIKSTDGKILSWQRYSSLLAARGAVDPCEHSWATSLGLEIIHFDEEKEFQAIQNITEKEKNYLGSTHDEATHPLEIQTCLPTQICTKEANFRARNPWAQTVPDNL